MSKARIGVVLVVVVAASTSVSSAARAGTTDPVAIVVDATAPGAPLERVWAYHGYDEVNYTTTPEGAELLATLAALHSAPVHVRTHFLFNSGDGVPALKWGSTNLYTEDASGNPIYDYTLIDAITDTTLDAGALPLVELGFMPEALSTHPTPYQNSGTYTLDGGCFYPPRDYERWGTLVSTWATHVKERYPAAQSSFEWELWNEPDIGYWQGTFDEYEKLYDYTEAALHAALPNASLGGPAVAGGVSYYLPRFLEHCATGTNAVTGTTGTRLDMLSFHAKGGTAVVDGHVELDLGNQLNLHRLGFEAVAQSGALASTPIVITEADPDGCAACPASDYPADAYRNSPAYGAYEVAMMKRSLELADETGVNLRGVLTWAFTFPGTPYFAGYRALATNGIHLPVLNAFKLLGALSGARLPVTSSGALALGDVLDNGVRGDADIDALASLDGDRARILVWNYHDQLVDAAPAPVVVKVALPASFGARVAVEHLRVDQDHGDAYTAWVGLGSPATPSASELAALKRAMEPVALGPTAMDVANGNVSISFELPRFGISLLTLSPAPAPEEATHAADAGCACRLESPATTRDASWALPIVALAAFRSRRRRAAAGASPATP